MDAATSTKSVVTSSERGQILLELVVISCFLVGFVLAMAALGSSTTRALGQYRFQNGSTAGFAAGSAAGSFNRSSSFR